MKPPYVVKDPHLQLMIRELYDRMGKVEPAIQKVQTQISGIKSTVETVLTPAGDEVPMQMNLPDTTKVGKATSASMAIPSSYYLDLRGTYVLLTSRRFTAEWLVLHDNSSPWKTITLTSVDETNNVATAGPIAGGRDQVAAFSSDDWVNFFIIYSPLTQDCSSLSSLSATAPTLPTGYEYFVRVGSDRYSSGVLQARHQFNDRVWHGYRYILDGTSDVLTTQSIALAVPPTAKYVFGIIGAGRTVAGTLEFKIATDTTNLHEVAFAVGAGDYTSNHPGGSWFEVPLSGQSVAYACETATASSCIIWCVGYVDDL